MILRFFRQAEQFLSAALIYINAEIVLRFLLNFTLDTDGVHSTRQPLHSLPQSAVSVLGNANDEAESILNYLREVILVTLNCAGHYMQSAPSLWIIVRKLFGVSLGKGQTFPRRLE